jgi:hypothetical protein
MSITRFGIEIETCVCDLKEGESDDGDLFAQKLNTISKEKGINVHFYFNSQPKSVHKYINWLITTDSSINCSSNDNLSSTHKEFFPLNEPNVCNFTSYEIVTPILNYTPKGISDFKDLLEQVLFYKDYLYEVDDSQGLHINISNPSQDKLKFLRFWWYFEPVILDFVPYSRRFSEYAIPLRRRLSTIDDLEEHWENFYENRDDGLGKYSCFCKG